MRKKSFFHVYKCGNGKSSDSLNCTYYYSDYHFVFGSKCKLIIAHSEFVFF